MEAPRKLSDPLSAIERGKTVTIGPAPVAKSAQARRRTGADLRNALEETPPPDDRFADDIADALALVVTDVGNSAQAV